MALPWAPSSHFTIPANCPCKQSLFESLKGGGGGGEQFYNVSLFLSKSVYSNLQEIQKCFPPICSYFLGVRVGRYALHLRLLFA